MAEYGVMILDENGKKVRTVKFSSLERCQAEVARHSNSMVVRLGRNSQVTAQGGRVHNGLLLGFDETRINPPAEPTKFLAQVDESGNIETPGEALARQIPDMRYNDICPHRTNAEKETWYDTPAGKAWVKKHPIPTIFEQPTPEYIHRRG